MPAVRGISQKNIVSLSSGEWSPDLDARVDQEKYDAAARELTNVFLLPAGPAERRAGLQFIGTAKIANKKARIIGYNFSVTTRFVLELGDLYMRFWSNGVQVTDGGSPVEIVTPWTEAQLFDIHYVQVNDIVYLTHPDVHPQKLRRITDINWIIEDVPFNETAFRDVNLTNTTLTSSVTALSANGILTASTGIFNADHVGSFWKLTHPRQASNVELDLASTGVSSTLIVQGTWSFRTTGTWTGTVRVQEFNNATGVFDNVREFTSNDDSNFDVEDDQPIEATFRIDYTSISGTGTAYLEVLDTQRSGIVKVTGFNSPTSLNITVTKALESTALTDLWNEGAWSTDQGFPRTTTIFEQRIMYGGTKKQPQTLFGSRTADYEDFKLGTSDDDAIQYTLASQEQNRIEWMSGQIKLLIGTAGGEWTFSGDSEKPVTPSNVAVFRQSTYGSRHLQGSMINDAVLYVQRNGLRVRQMIESETSVTAKYVSPDLTIFADHITAGAVVQTDYAQQPHSTYWAVNGIGELIGMTYERDQQISGWQRYKSPGANGFIESVAIIYGDTAKGDEIWLSIKRTINGSDVRHIERINPVDWIDQVDAFYVDSGISKTLPTFSSGDLQSGDSYRVIDNTGMDMSAVGGPASPKVFETFTATITATPVYGTGSVREVSDTFVNIVPHLAGETVQALGDGGVVENLTVGATGTVTLPDENKVTTVHVGLQYDSIIQPMKLNADPRLGAYMGTELRIRQLVIRVQRSLGMTYITNLKLADNVTDKEELFPFRDTKNLMDQAPPLRTGDIVFPLLAGHDFDGDLILKQTQPLPFKVLAIIKKFQVTGK